MDIYWSYRSVPELQTFPTGERKAAWRAAHRKGLRTLRPWIVFLLGVVIAPFIYVYFSSYLLNLPYWLQHGVTVFLIGMGSFAFGQAATQAARAQLRRST